MAPRPINLRFAVATRAVCEISGGGEPPPSFLARMSAMPGLVTEWVEHKLWPAQITAIHNLEKSLAAISFIYRLIKFAGARRVRQAVLGKAFGGAVPDRLALFAIRE